MLVLSAISSNNVTAYVKRGDATTSVSITFQITENDAALTNKSIEATIDWEDGGAVEEIPVGYATMTVTRSHAFKPGTYFVKVTASNYRSPVPDQTTKYFQILVLFADPVAVPKQYLIGPILPKDNGYPNADQWAMQIGYDDDILKSSVKMLLLTSKGERICEPNYGTNLKQLVFNQRDDTIQSIAEEEITLALSTYEPRVSLVSLSADTTSVSRSVILSATFQSKLDQHTFELSLAYAA